MRRRFDRRKNLKRSRSRFGLSLWVFVILLLIFVITRIAFFSVLTFDQVCSNLHPQLFGNAGSIDAVLDTTLVIFIAAAGVWIASGISDLVSSSLKPADYFVAVLNLALIVLFLRLWLSTWAFFYPYHPAAAQFAAEKENFLYSSLYSMRSYKSFEGVDHWQEVAPNTYFNEGIGIYAREEIIRTCFPAPFVRQQLENRWPSGQLPTGEVIADLPDSALEQHETLFFYYDTDGNYLTSETPWQHRRFEALMERDAERDERLGEFEPYEIVKLVDESLEDVREEPPQLRPYTREEIDEMVARTWERETGIP